MSRSILIRLTLLTLFLFPEILMAAAEMEIMHSLALPEKPLDAVITPSGKHIYVLTRSGEVIIFNSRGKQTDIIPVGKDITAIRIGPRDDNLLLLSPEKQQVRVALVNFIYTIDTDGSPFKGNQEAPVEVVVFSDFE